MSRKAYLSILIPVFVLLVAGGGYYYYQNVHLPSQEPVEEETITTYKVGRGDLVITASGSGTLIPSNELSLGFRSSGVLVELMVQVGDEVEAGQVLARLDDADAQDQLSSAKINLQKNELTLANLVEDVGPVELAAAEISLSSANAGLTKLTVEPTDMELLSAQENLKSAQERLSDLLDGPDQSVVDAAEANVTLAEYNVQIAQSAYDRIADQPGAGATRQAMDLWQATTNYEKAVAEHQELLQGAAAEDIADANSKIALAQAQMDALFEEPDADELAAAEAKVTQAQTQFDELLAGASENDLASAQLNVDQAQLNLQSARRTLDNTMLIAPSSGTVTAVAADVGESVGSGSIITLAGLDEPLVKFWVEEADLASVVRGNAVSFVFEALPDFTYSGIIESVDPVLVTVDGTPAVQSYASIDLSNHPISLLSGMNAEIEVIAGEAHNAILVPLQALREMGPGQYAVFVVDSSGELEMRIVEVGLKDFVNAEIKSGLEAGETVSLGIETTGDTVDGTQDSSQVPSQGIMRIIGGG
ncbi:MAG: efflux RND transporter periplasmic adaptor subunit [Chloroflexota bacterium]